MPEDNNIKIASRPDGETNRKIIISRIIIVNQWGGSIAIAGSAGDAFL